jgi:5-methylcytosine-specific restriction endonuclease McrA
VPIRLCLEARCGERATVRGRCAVHAAVERKGNRSKFDSFYDSRAWKMSRRKQLSDHPLCQYVDPRTGTECGLVADSVHHVVELTKGGAKRDPANLMSTCRSCHSKIHAQRRGAF